MEESGGIRRMGVLRKHAGFNIEEELLTLVFLSDEVSQEVIADVLHKGGIVPDGKLRIVSIKILDRAVSMLPQEQRFDARKRLAEGLAQEFADRIGDRADGIAAPMGTGVIAFLHEKQTDLVDLVREATEHMEPVHVCISPSSSAMDRVPAQIKSIREAEDGRRFYEVGDTELLCVPDDIAVRLTDEEQRMQFELGFRPACQYLSGALRAGDRKLVEEHLLDILEKIAENTRGLPYPTVLNMTVNRFFSQLQHELTVEDLAEWRFLSRMDFSRRLIECRTLTDYYEKGREIAGLLVAHVRQRAENQHDVLMREIQTFVKEGYADINMGLTMVAREFRIKPREAAERYRGYFGESINDTLHRARVEKAKKLILTTDEPIQEIAKKVGYVSLATMYRAFTNLEGVAPGKLRGHS